MFHFPCIMPDILDRIITLLTKEGAHQQFNEIFSKQLNMFIQCTAITNVNLAEIISYVRKIIFCVCVCQIDNIKITLH